MTLHNPKVWNNSVQNLQVVHTCTLTHFNTQNSISCLPSGRDTHITLMQSPPEATYSIPAEILVWGNIHQLLSHRLLFYMIHNSSSTSKQSLMMRPQKQLLYIQEGARCVSWCISCRIIVAGRRRGLRHTFIMQHHTGNMSRWSIPFQQLYYQPWYFSTYKCDNKMNDWVSITVSLTTCTL